MITRVKPDYQRERGTQVSLWCPGCSLLHHVNVGGTVGPQWDWDGEAERPTISPSILVRWGNADGEQACHSFVRAGRWEFLADSTHALAGQTVDVVPIPEEVFGQ